MTLVYVVVEGRTELAFVKSVKGEGKPFYGELMTVQTRVACSA